MVRQRAGSPVGVLYRVCCMCRRMCLVCVAELLNSLSHYLRRYATVRSPARFCTCGFVTTPIELISSYLNLGLWLICAFPCISYNYGNLELKTRLNYQNNVYSHYLEYTVGNTT
jgi:hypothetical protein